MYNTMLASCSNKLLSELIGCSSFISCTGKILMHEQVPINLLFQSIRKAFDGCKVTWASGFFWHLYEAVQGNREVWHQLFRVSFLVAAIYAVGTHQSYLTDQARYEGRKPYNCYRPLPPTLWRVTWPNASAAPLILSCTCAMHGFAMAGAAPREKRSNQNYKDEHLGSWPVYVRRCGPADWLVSKQRAPSHEQNLSCMQSTNGHAKTQWCHWQV